MARDRDGVVWHTACGGGFGRLRARVQPRRWAPPLAELARHAPGVQHWELRPRVRAIDSTETRCCRTLYRYRYDRTCIGSRCCLVSIQSRVGLRGGLQSIELEIWFFALFSIVAVSSHPLQDHLPSSLTWPLNLLMFHAEFAPLLPLSRI